VGSNPHPRIVPGLVILSLSFLRIRVDLYSREAFYRSLLLEFPQLQKTRVDLPQAPDA